MVLFRTYFRLDTHFNHSFMGTSGKNNPNPNERVLKRPSPSDMATPVKKQMFGWDVAHTFSFWNGMIYILYTPLCHTLQSKVLVPFLSKTNKGFNFKVIAIVFVSWLYSFYGFLHLCLNFKNKL